MGKISTLMYGWEFPPKISGGLGVACYAIVKELAKKGVALHLVLPYTAPQNDFDHVNFIGTSQVSNNFNHELPGVNIKSLKIATSISPYARGLGMGLSGDLVEDFLLLLSQLSLPEVMKAIISSIVTQDGNLGMKDHYEVSLLTEVLRYAQSAGNLGNTIDHDIIHAHDWLTILAALEAKSQSGKPLVFHLHALETDRGGCMIDQRIFAIEKYGMERADLIIAVSDYTKNNIVHHYGIDPNKIRVVHNGIYPKVRDDQVAKKNPMVLFLGRITQQKGPYFFIEMAKKILAHKPDVQFVLAGSGDLLPSMIEHVAGLRIGKNVHFTGFLSGDQVKQIYQLADVYVMSSVSEPFGLSALEALSLEVPAVISKQSGVIEVLNHALIADFWDVDDMASKVLALLDYPALGKTLLKHTKNDLEQLTWENTAQKIIVAYDDFMKRD